MGFNLFEWFGDTVETVGGLAVEAVTFGAAETVNDYESESEALAKMRSKGYTDEQARTELGNVKTTKSFGSGTTLYYKDDILNYKSYVAPTPNIAPVDPQEDLNISQTSEVSQGTEVTTENIIDYYGGAIKLSDKIVQGSDEYNSELYNAVEKGLIDTIDLTGFDANTYWTKKTESLLNDQRVTLENELQAEIATQRTEIMTEVNQLLIDQLGMEGIDIDASIEENIGEIAAYVSTKFTPEELDAQIQLAVEDKEDEMDQNLVNLLQYMGAETADESIADMTGLLKNVADVFKSKIYEFNSEIEEKNENERTMQNQITGLINFNSDISKAFASGMDIDELFNEVNRIGELYGIATDSIREKIDALTTESEYRVQMVEQLKADSESRAAWEEEERKRRLYIDTSGRGIVKWGVKKPYESMSTRDLEVKMMNDITGIYFADRISLGLLSEGA